MKIVNSRIMAGIDRKAQEEYHIPSTILMENAGIKACNLIIQELSRGSLLQGKLVLVAGKGNNGGDALVMARQFLLQGSRDITIVLASGPPREHSDPHINLSICRELDIKIIDYTKDPRPALEEINHAHWIFDGIAGTGIKGELKSSLAGLVNAINGAGGRTIAIDVPSGLGDAYRKGYTCIKADHTLTMGLPKLCLYRPPGRINCGKIHVVKLGFPPALVNDPAIPGTLLQVHDLRQLNPPLPPDTYKTRRGHLAVFAGSTGTTGAAWLCCTAAARAQAGLVTFFAEESIYPVVAPGYHSVMIKKWQTGRDLADPGRFTGFLAGPGWGINPVNRRWLEHLCSLAVPCVIDADGLSLLAEIRRVKKLSLNGRFILTPHPGEFSRLTDISAGELLENPLPHVLALAEAWDAVVVLKGHITFIAAPTGEYSILDSMNPAMATAGSGDVLAGLAAAFLAAGKDAFTAARLGVLVHSLAGRQAYREKGWFIAEDLVPVISQILRHDEQNE